MRSALKKAALAVAAALVAGALATPADAYPGRRGGHHWGGHHHHHVHHRFHHHHRFGHFHRVRPVFVGTRYVYGGPVYRAYAADCIVKRKVRYTPWRKVVKVVRICH